MKRILISLFIILSSVSYVAAQDRLWATGSAVPEGTRELVKQRDGKFRFTGALNEGELKIMTTATFQKGVTEFLAPQLVNSYLINYGLKYQKTTSETREGWVVSFQEDYYRFIVDVNDQTVRGELFLPWNELLIAGSAFPGGSDNEEWKRDNMLPFTRDHENPFVFEWTGELDIYSNVIEPGYFKLEGQMTWGPKELHPYQHGEDILNAKEVRIGGDDTKWRVVTPGTYRIRVNLFEQTIESELLTRSQADGQGIDDLQIFDSRFDSSEQSVNKSYDLQGRQVDNGKSANGQLIIVRQKDGRFRKIFAK